MITTKKSELVLSEEVRDFYGKCQRIADEGMEKLAKELVSGWKEGYARWWKEDLKRIKDPYRRNEMIIRDAEKSMAEWQPMSHSPVLASFLNDLFAESHKLPRIIMSKGDFMQILEYTRKNYGINTKVLEIDASPDGDWHGGCNDDGSKILLYGEKTTAIAAIGGIMHEMDHIKHNSFEWELFYADLRARAEVFNRAIANGAGSKLANGKRLLMAMDRYIEGRATFAETALLGSKDAPVRAHYAIYFTDSTANPTPRFWEGIGKQGEASYARRYSEGFRDYYTLQARVGKNVLDDFEQKCEANGLFPGIEKGELFVVDPKKLEMFRIDMQKLRIGVTEIEELKIKPEPRLQLRNLR